MNGSLQLAREYSAKASPYAELWAPVLLPMAEPILPRLPLAGARTILDIGTGTGGFLPPLVAHAPRAQVIGSDLSIGMLRRARDAGIGALAAMDAQRLAVRDRMIDIVTGVFMLFHVPDPIAALKEAHRALRPGGVIGIVTWGQDPGTPGQAIWAEELDAAGAAPDPRSRDVMRQDQMDTPDTLAALLASAGFGELVGWSAWHTRSWTVAGLLAVQVGCGLPARRLPSLDAAARTACEERVRQRTAQLTDSERVYTVEVLYAVARATVGGPQPQQQR